MATPEQRKWTLDEISEIYFRRMTPAAAGVAIGILRAEEITEREEREETARMQRMADIVDEYDEITLLEEEDGGTIVRSNSIMYVAKDYLYELRDEGLIDELDMKARILSLYILAMVDGPHSGGELLEDELEYHPIDKSLIVSRIKQYIVEKFGPYAWQPDFDTMEFIDLFTYQNTPYLNDESFTEILSKQPLMEEIREELIRRGYGLRRNKRVKGV